MKKNAWLLGILVALIVITWLVTERKIFESVPTVQAQLKAEVENLRQLRLPAAELSQDSEGVWRSSDGEVVRAEYLQELHKNLEQFKISRTFAARDIPPGSNPYFNSAVHVGINQLKLVIGDLTPTGDGFYFTIDGHSEVYLMDLQEMSSQAVGDTDNILQREKYNRMMDLIQLSTPRWREKRLAALVRFGSFREWRSGEYSLDILQLRDKPWATVIFSALQAGIASLEVEGAIVTQKPAKQTKLDNWSFVLEDNSEASWEFYEHPSLQLIYVWIPRLGKGYPLNQASSDFLRDFTPRLIKKSFSITIHPAPIETARLQEGEDQWIVAPNRVFTPDTIEQTHANNLLDFFSTKQTFDHLSLVTKRDCLKLRDGARYQVSLGSENEDIWGVLPVKGGLIFLECQTGIALGWSTPLDSSLDFATLRKLK